MGCREAGHGVFVPSSRHGRKRILGARAPVILGGDGCIPNVDEARYQPCDVLVPVAAWPACRGFAAGCNGARLVETVVGGNGDYRRTGLTISSHSRCPAGRRACCGPARSADWQLGWSGTRSRGARRRLPEHDHASSRRRSNSLSRRCALRRVSSCCCTPSSMSPGRRRPVEGVVVWNKAGRSLVGLAIRRLHRRRRFGRLCGSAVQHYKPGERGAYHALLPAVQRRLGRDGGRLRAPRLD